MAKPTPARKFAVFDIDGTLLRWQMLHAIYDNLGKGDQLEEGDYQRMLSARMEWKNRKDDEGFIAYQDELVAIVGRNLSNISVADFQRAADETFAEYQDQVYRYTRDLIRGFKKQGRVLLAISGSPTEIVKLIADKYGFDDFVATVHEENSGRYTGKIMVASLRKPEILRELAAKHNLTFDDSIAVGDSEGDIDMLELAAHPIAFNPSKILFRHAERQGWSVVVERKNMVYEFQPVNGHYKLTHTNA